jgi:putative inorganic carbon (HCO3(-)) transporter
MERAEVGSAWRVLALLAPLVAALAVVIDLRSRSGLKVGPVFLSLGASAAIIAAFYVLWHLPTVYMLGGGLLLSIFSGSWQYLGLPGIPDRLLLLGSLLTLLVREGEQLARFRLTVAHVLLVALVLYAVISSAVAGTLGHHLATFQLLDQLGAIPFLLFFAAPLIVSTEAHRRALLTMLIGLGLYLSVEALLESVKAYGLVIPHYIVNPTLGSFDARVRGPFMAPVTEGFALFGCTIAAAVALTMPLSRAVRIMAKICIPLCLLGCFLTLERGVWIGTVLAVVSVGVLTPVFRRRILPSLVVGTVVIASALLFIPGLNQVAAQRSRDTLSIYDRQNQNAAAYRMILTRPLFGFGWSTFPQAGLAYFRQSPSYPMTGYGIVLHDVYLSMAVELGLVGFILWLAAQGTALLSGFTGRAHPKQRAWRIGLLAFVIFTVTVELFNPLQQSFAQLLLWTWAGISAGTNWNDDPERVEQRHAEDLELPPA